MAKKQKKAARRKKNLRRKEPPIRGVIKKALWLLYDVGFYVFLAVIIAAALYAFSITDKVRDKFEGRRWNIASKVYSDALKVV